VPATHVPIYAVDPVTASSVLFTSVNGASAPHTADCFAGDSAAPANACGDASFFSFDIFRQGTWSFGTPPGGGGPGDPHPGFLGVDGVFQNNCFSTFYHQDQNGTHDWHDLIASAVVAGDGYLYVGWEDDATVYKISETDCSIVGGFSYPYNGENALEEEQIACDPLTLGTPVLWIRNSGVTADVARSSPSAGANEVAAYPVPDAYCPFPTRLSYSGPTIVKPGAPVELCFTLNAALAGEWQPLNGQPITVAMAGHPVGQPVTDSSGRACLATNATVTPGAVTVQGNFVGTNAYLPSGAEGTLLVLPTGSGLTVGAAMLPGPPLGGLPAPQPATGPQPNPAPGTEPVGSVSTQIEAQVQAQSQSQSQAQSVAQVQPGVMVQRQKRTQVAIQEQGPAVNTAYEARALRHARPAPVVALAMGLVMLGFGLVAGRPRWAMARVRPKWRRR
jgi:hypothetical protein